MSFLPYRDWTPDGSDRVITIQGFDYREDLIEHLGATGATPEEIEQVRESFREADRLFGREENGN